MTFEIEFVRRNTNFSFKAKKKLSHTSYSMNGIAINSMTTYGPAEIRVII